MSSPPHNSASASILSSKKLPPELIGQIFQDVIAVQVPIPSPAAVDTIKESRATLRSICLSSKQFREIAQPLLLSDILVEGNAQIKLDLLLSNNSAEALTSIRTIRLFEQVNEARFANHLVNLARAATGLTKILCAGGKSCLQPFFGSNLTTMSLFHHVLGGSGPFSFPMLKYLSLFACEVQEGSGGDLQFDLPSLRHLALTPTCSDNSDNLMCVIHTTASTLQTLSYPLRYASRLPPSVSAVPCCFDFYSQSVRSFPKPTSLDPFRLFIPSLFPTYGGDPPQEVLRIEEWTEAIEEDLFSPQVLIIPTLSIDTDDEEYMALKLACDGLAEVCKEKKIEVVREKCKGSFDFWDFVSPSFIRKVEAASKVEQVECSP
ncbi:hypothetical protein JCM5350_002279 [Sporobolomyces pararoseus]